LVSGYVYHDANHSSARDGGEAGTGLTLYAKLIPALLPGGPAVLSAAVDPATGAYSIPGVSSGLYIVVIDDNAILTDVTPTLPAGWIGTEVPDQRRSNVSVGITDVPNQNFGLYNGSRITGRVFNDQGSGGGTPNDGVQNGAEARIAGVDVRVTDGTGATTFDSTITGGGGDYTLWVPAAAGNNPLRVVEANLTGYLSTGGQVGTTGGTYDRGTDVTAFTHTAGTIYTGVNFADVPVNQHAASRPHRPRAAPARSSGASPAACYLGLRAACSSR